MSSRKTRKNKKASSRPSRKTPTPVLYKKILGLEKTNQNLQSQLVRQAQSEHKYRQLIERSNDAVFVVELKTRKFMDCNAQAEKLLGRSRAKILSLRIEQIHPKDVMARNRKEFELIASGKNIHVETVILTADKKRKAVSIKGAPLVIDGRACVMGIFRDISEAKEIEARILAERDFSNSTLESLPGVFYLFDQKGKFLRWNKNFEKVTGYSAKEISRMSPLDFFTGKDKKNIRERIGEVFKKGISNAEASFTTKSGKRIPYYFTGRAVPINEKVCLVGMGIDATERQQAGTALRDSEGRFRSLFENSQDAMMTLEPPSWRFTSGNPAMVRMFRAKNEKEFTTYPPWLLSPEQQPDGRSSIKKAKAMIKKTMRTGGNFFEWRHKRIDGEEFPAEVLLNRVELGGKKLLQATVRDITERKKAEETLNRAAAEWKSTFNALSDAVWLLDSDQRIVRANAATKKILPSFTPKLLGCHCWEVFHKSSKPIPGCPVVRAGKTKRRETMELQVGKKWFLVSVDPVLNARKQIIGFVHIVSDITQRKQVEKTLRLSDFSIDHTSDAVYWIGPDARFLYVNDAACRTLGYTRAELLKRGVQDIDLDFPMPRWVMHWRELKRKKTMMIDSFHKTKKGRIFPVEISINFLEFEGKEYNFAFARDITERKRTEEALWQSRQQLRQIIDTVPHMIFAKNKKGQFLLANRAVGVAYGKPLPWIIGKDQRSIHPVLSEAETFTKDDREVIRAGRAKVVGAQPFTDAKGNVRMLQTFKIPFQAAGIHEPAMLGVAVDVTEQRKVEEFRNDVIRTISHELQTPLSIEKSGISLFLDGLAGSITPEQRKILETVMRNIDRLARMIHSLLDVSHIETGKMKLERRPVNFNNLVQEVIAEFKPKVKEHEICFGEFVPGPPIMLFADADKIVAVLSNLIDNSIKFTEQGTIDVVVRASKDEMECTVRDTGLGIAPENMPKIFEKFQQFSRMAGPGEKGLGLGLSISRGIVEMHGGRIWAKSQLGKGTQTTFSLPLSFPDVDAYRKKKMLFQERVG